jgi:uncharacterized membrane protein YdfJ with MMPL/SSD domain
VVKRPHVALIVTVVVLVPLAVYGSGLARDFDLLADLSETNEAREGFDVLAAHLGAGEMQPLNVVIVDSAGFDTPEGLQRTEGLARALAGLPHVATVSSFTDSLPDDNTLSVAHQLSLQADAVDEALVAGVDTAALETAAAQLMDVYGYLAQLARAYPQVLTDPGYTAATAALGRLAILAGEEPATLDAAALQKAVGHLRALAGGLRSLRDSFATRPDAILLPDLYLKNNQGLKALRDAYLSTDGSAARLQVVLDSGPYSPEALDTTQAIRSTLAETDFIGGVEGNSSVTLDLREAADRDMTRAIIFVLGGIFIVLLLLLRALVAPIYLILTILLSYAATLGVIRLLFVDILGTTGITWWVPLFMFVMLVALGMDYNIFLIGRVKEEVRLHGTLDGTKLALARTGGIITSAGIIVAGTFASMMSASILGLLQIGFAVAFGVLLDTFVVRTTLVPALVVLLGRWSWWPSHLRGPKDTEGVD